MDSLFPKEFSFAPLAQAMSFISMFSPIPLFLEVIKTGNTKKIPNFAFQSASIMLLGWVAYAYVINNMELLKASSMSLVALTLYASLAYVLKREYVKLLIFYVVLVALAFIYTSISPSILGTVSAVSQVAAASANLELIVKAFREKNGGYFNRGTIFLTLPACSIWALYGIELKDIAVTIPPMYDTTLVLIQLATTIIFSKKDEKKNE